VLVPSPPRPTSPLRAAIIDIGSASIRSVALEIAPSGERRILAEDRSMTKLAAALASTGLLTPQAISHSVRVIADFVTLARSLSCSVIRAFATSAVREARNAPDFLRAVRDATAATGPPLHIEIISEQEEGLLALRSAATRADITQGLACVADLGGGSLEVVLTTHGIVELNASLPLGAVRLTDHFGGGEACSTHAFPALHRHVADALAREIPTPRPTPLLIASGGTLTSLARIARGFVPESSYLATDDPSRWTVRTHEVHDILDRVRHTPIDRRHQIPGLQPDRADIIVAGLVVVQELMSRLAVESLLVNPAGLREGLLLKVIDDARSPSP
jgi:exopolyphosphatase/guanosine-5'-triphosphate,3'-diphosphate pyrophosphatase